MTQGRAIVKCAVGLDNIEVDSASAHGIVVCNIADYCTEEVSDHTVGLLLAAVRRIPSMDRHICSGGWVEPPPLPAVRRFRNLTLGIIGLGRIGSAVARKLRGFEMRILATDPYLNGPVEPAIELVPLQRLLRESDLISLHVPLSVETRNLIGTAELACMKPSAMIVNTSPGPVIDEEALIAALREGRIAGAALDVASSGADSAVEPAARISKRYSHSSQRRSLRRCPRTVAGYRGELGRSAHARILAALSRQPGNSASCTPSTMGRVLRRVLKGPAVIAPSALVRSIVCIGAGFFAMHAAAAAGPGPVEVARFEVLREPVRLPDGSILAVGIRLRNGIQEVDGRVSRHEGTSWSPPRPLFRLPREAGGFGFYATFVDRRGEIHIFLLCDGNTGSALPVKDKPATQVLDIWQVRSTASATAWESPRRIWAGRAGDLLSVVQLPGGRIVLPISFQTSRSWSHRDPGFPAFTNIGQFSSSVLYSDDDGATWRQSPSILTTPTPAIGSIGGVEPDVGDGWAGAVSLDLIVALIVTSLARARIGRRAWRAGARRGSTPSGSR